MTTTAQSKILDRIVKLFALGNTSVNTSEEEVHAAVTKAKQLMIENELTLHDLEVHSAAGKKVAAKIEVNPCYTLAQKFAVYDDYVAAACDAICNTKSLTSWRYWNGKKFWTRHFVGTEADIKIAGELFLVLLDTLRRAARNRFGRGWSKKHADYGNGFAMRLYSRAKDAKPDLTPVQEETMGLVLRDKNQAIDDFIKKTWVMKDPKKRKIDETPEFWKGLADGAKVDIGDPRRRIK